ncbi:YggS family pyridoxal phosphate-dependent enzyme [Dactylosporangium sp. AC04546]|nr:YggS family pyridoxal phosphate-dependent enzyme [Dactylosporangium sp. AC04546]WVK82112.1 YggS family pyridoxal phosphate-dependent enzyme [Dactylosporangium sp. AC04546]
MDARSAQIGRNLAQVRERIAAACAAAGRSPDGVTLVAVTKTYPAQDVTRLAALGVHDVGENRDQEAAPKAEEVADPAVRWHFVGQLQRNKARSVVRYASAVHSVDSLRLVDALVDAAVKAERPEPLDALVQVSLDDDEQRGGAVTGMVEQVAAAIAASPALRLRGVMDVAPLGMGLPSDPRIFVGGSPRSPGSDFVFGKRLPVRGLFQAGLEQSTWPRDSALL